MKFLAPSLLTLLATVPTAFSKQLREGGGRGLSESDSSEGFGTGPPDGIGTYCVGYTQTLVPIVYERSGQALGPLVLPPPFANIDQTVPLLPTEIWYPTVCGSGGTDAAIAIPIPGIDIQLPLPPNVSSNAPPATGPHPLVVFSHSYTGLSFEYIDMMIRLASHGHVVAAPVHRGSSFLDVIGVSLEVPGAVVDEVPNAALDRPKDISAVINHVLGDIFSSIVDQEKIAVVGRSLGGLASMSVAGGIGNVLQEPPYQGDSRVKAIVPISTASELIGGQLFFSPGELASIDIPVLLLSAEDDATTPIAQNVDPLWAEIQCQNEDNLRIDVLNAGHNSMADLCLFENFLSGILSNLSNPQEIQLLWFLLGALASYTADGCASTLIDNEDAKDIAGTYTIAFLKKALNQDGADEYEEYLEKEFAEETSILSNNLDFTNSAFEVECGESESESSD